jgi:hypothetical protein
MTPQDPFEAFRRSSHEEREIPYEPGDWDALHQRLDADATPARGVSPWWMVLLLLPLSGLFYLQQLNMAQQRVLNENLLVEVQTLRQAIDSPGPSSFPQVLNRIDTVYQERIVYRERTVYRSTIETPRLRPGTLLPGGFKDGFSSPLTRLSQVDELATSLVSPPRAVAPVTDLLTTDDDLSSESYLPVGLLPRAGIDELVLPFLLPIPGPIEVQPGSKRRIVRGPLVKGWNFDFAIGLNATTDEDQPALPALLTDLRLGARLGKGWSLFLGVAGEYATFDFEDFDPTIGLAPFPAPSEEFIFHNANLRRYAAYGQVGLGWQLPTEGRWSPFIDVAYLRDFSSESKIDYYYKNIADMYIVLGRPDRYDRPANLLNFGAGMFYTPTKSSAWRIGLGGRYQSPLKQDKLNPARIGLNLRLGYRF